MTAMTANMVRLSGSANALGQLTGKDYYNYPSWSVQSEQHHRLDLNRRYLACLKWIGRTDVCSFFGSIPVLLHTNLLLINSLKLTSHLFLSQSSICEPKGRLDATAPSSQVMQVIHFCHNQG